MAGYCQKWSKVDKHCQELIICLSVACEDTGHSTGWLFLADAQVACEDTGHGEDNPCPLLTIPD
ncbi:hypothetical protein GCM10028809_55380 [Spirosoma gilvum]